MGQVVIRQGEEGDEFFILLEGETQVFRENSNGTSDLLSILYSGDSFGETALIEKCNRTATVRASKHCVLLSLSTKNFQKLFSVNSGKAKDFTNLIRNIKLIQDSQALSHLTATEIRKLLQKSNEVVFEKGQAVVERGEEADEVFIIKEGEAAVFIDGQTVAKVGKGDLVGVIAVIKDIQRTADVVAQSKLRCLKIPKEHFLSVCLSNLLVALLVADLSDAQIAEQKAA
jgi:CRP-like cAMP-binding protein